MKLNGSEKCASHKNMKLNGSEKCASHKNMKLNGSEKCASHKNMKLNSSEKCASHKHMKLNGSEKCASHKHMTLNGSEKCASHKNMKLKGSEKCASHKDGRLWTCITYFNKKTTSVDSFNRPLIFEEVLASKLYIHWTKKETRHKNLPNRGACILASSIQASSMNNIYNKFNLMKY